MLDIIKNNPFRFLGVFSNTSKKEIVANKGKLTAFARIGKQLPFVSDFNEILGTIVRTPELISESEGRLTLPNDIVRYSMFWFIKQTSEDDTSIELLKEGDIEEAIDNWDSITSSASLQNKVVCYLILEDYENAFSCAEELFECYSDEFLDSMMNGEYSSYDSDTLFSIFCDEVLNNAGITNSQWDDINYSLTNESFLSYIRKKRSTPYIKAIQDTIERFDTANTPLEDLQNAENIKENTIDAVEQLNDILDTSDAMYQLTMDKLSNSILSKAIAYYNKSDEADCAVKALPLMKYAGTLAIGEQQINRCETNIDTVQEAADAYNNPQPVESVSEPFESISSALSSLTDLLNELELKQFIMPFLKAGEIILGKTWTFDAISLGYHITEVGEFREISFGGFKFVDLFKRYIFDYATYTSYEIEQEHRDYYHFNEYKSFNDWIEFFEKMGFQMHIDKDPYIYEGETTNFYCGDISGYCRRWNLAIKINFFEITDSTYASLYYDNIRMNRVDVYTLQSGDKPFLAWFE